MEKCEFVNLDARHKKEVIDIFNYYIENSYSAYPENVVSEDFYDKLLEMTKGYPAYAIKVEDTVIGFCFLRAFHQFPVFSETAEITYFINNNFCGKGLGKIALQKLEDEARHRGIYTILASISSENKSSIAFHLINGFTECGRFPGVGKKFGNTFDMVWMVKKLAD